ncbi:MAG: hypothetical protein ACREON_19130 [Gemmatimonadaceae bacterium]
MIRDTSRCLAGAALAAALVAPPLVASSLDAQQPAQATVAWVPARDSGATAAKPSDVSSVDNIMKALYDVISGPAGQKRDWNRMRSLFIPGARLIPSRPRREGGGAEVLVLDLEGYITRSGPFLEREGFFETEVARQMESYGNIAHAFSTYESRRTPQEQPFSRGINSIQLLKDGNRWWIVTIYWDSERPDNPIPAQYLRSGQ